MENKIYEKIKEKQKECSDHYSKLIGIDTEHYDTIPTKNFDLMNLLKKLELLPEDCDKLDEINEFYDYLFKLGIETGINLGKRQAITEIRNNSANFEEFMEIDPEMIVNYNVEPTFISDLKEALLNEK